MVHEYNLLGPGAKYSKFILAVCLAQKWYGKKPATHKKFKQNFVVSLEHEGMTTNKKTQKPKHSRLSSGLPDEKLKCEPNFTDREEKGLSLMSYIK